MSISTLLFKDKTCWSGLKLQTVNLRPAAFDFPLQTLRLLFDQPGKVHYHMT